MPFEDSRQKARELAVSCRDYAINWREHVAVFLESPSASRTRMPLTLPRQDIFTGDIIEASERFALTLALSQAIFGDAVGVVRAVTSMIPIDMTTALLRGRITGSKVQRPTIGDFFGQPPFDKLGVQTASQLEAARFFHDGLSRFLYTRFEARESDISDKPGCLFTVTANTEGLRIHYSKAFIFDPHHVFGSPTNPVRRWLQPGDYYFGAIGPEQPLWFDLQSEYEVPEITHAHLNR
jgi:hypothetical protein